MKTIHQYRGYVFTIEFSSELPEWIVDFKDFKNIITAGSTLDEAFHNACGALDLHLETIQKLGEEVPRPRQQLQLVTVEMA